MQESTSRWLRKAEGDFRSVDAELNCSDPNFDAVCYHAQQCIEKLLKAIMIEENRPFPKIHALKKLLALVTISHPELSDLMPDITKLDNLSTDVRYPYEFALRPDAEECTRICIETRIRLRAILIRNDNPLFEPKQ